jgi:hypothetical protein
LSAKAQKRRRREASHYVGSNQQGGSASKASTASIPAISRQRAKPSVIKLFQRSIISNSDYAIRQQWRYHQQGTVQ